MCQKLAHTGWQCGFREPLSNWEFSDIRLVAWNQPGWVFFFFCFETYFTSTSLPVSFSSVHRVWSQSQPTASDLKPDFSCMLVRIGWLLKWTLPESQWLAKIMISISLIMPSDVIPCGIDKGGGVTQGPRLFPSGVLYHGPLWQSGENLTDLYSA